MAVAARTANSTARLFRTGRAPGRPRQTGQMLVLGAAPNFDEQPQKALVRVSSCTWTSRPMTGSYLVRISGEMLAATAITGLILAAGRMKRRLPCYLATTMRWSWLLILFCCAVPFRGQTVDQWLVVPGKSVGLVTAKTTPAKLRLIFPESKVKDDMVSSGGDADPEPATVVNGDDPETALTIFRDKAAETGPRPAVTAHPTSVNLCYGNGPTPKTC